MSNNVISVGMPGAWTLTAIWNSALYPFIAPSFVRST